jgi:hypothetical protein
MHEFQENISIFSLLTCALGRMLAFPFKIMTKHLLSFVPVILNFVTSLSIVKLEADVLPSYHVHRQ